MYAPDIVSQRIEQAQLEAGFRLEYHSPGDLDTFNANLEANYPDAFQSAQEASQGQDPAEAGRSVQIALMRALCNPEHPRLSRDEVRFMQNERYLCMCDAAYFLTRQYRIKDRENIIRRFHFQDGQRAFFNVVSELESMGAAIEIANAKARQLGVSTINEGVILHRACFTYGTNGVIASADPTKTGEMSQMLFLGYDMMDWWIRPLTTRRVESDRGLVKFGGMKSGVIFQHGSQTSGIARGSTPTVYHLSEVASYINAGEIIDDALFKAVHPSPRVYGTLESTCEGDVGWWPDTYWNAKNNWKNGGSRLMALFLPFWVGTDMYPNQTWLRTRPVPEDWRPTQETRKMMAESKMYLQSNQVLEKVLGAKWEMPQSVAWYWEKNFLEARTKGREKFWLQEMPHTDRAAFQGSYDNVFGRETIAEVWTKRSTKYGVYAIIGQSIEDRHEPAEDEVEYGAVRIPIAYRSRRGETYRWELVPLNWTEPFENIEDIKDDDSHMGKFFVYLEPEAGYDYSIGVDTSNGINADATCIAVSRRGRTPLEEDVQAAEFRSDKVSHVEAYAWTLAIAAYYARHMAENAQYREPYVSIEQIAAVGDTCQLQMMKMGYSRFHKMTAYHTRLKDMKKADARRVGWYTSGITRPILTDGFVNLVKNGWYKVNSPYTQYEMDHWEVHLTRGGKQAKFEHSSATTDDGIFANAMAAFCPNDMKNVAERSTKRIDESERSKNPRLDLTPYGGIVVSTEGHGILDQDRSSGW